MVIKCNLRKELKSEGFLSLLPRVPLTEIRLLTIRLPRVLKVYPNVKPLVVFMTAMIIYAII